MTDEDVLYVWHEKHFVGELWRNSAGTIGFRYDKNWLQTGFSISQQLPLQLHEFPSELGTAHQFFANLLPEADARLHIVRDLKITNSDFELLKAIGGECAGAISILPTALTPKSVADYKKLDPNELRKILLRKGQIFNLTTNNNRPRLSLAGAQDKCPIFFDGKQYSLPQGAATSTHILKFEISGYKNIPLYECFLTKFAASIGLPTVNIDLKKFEDRHYLLIERFDRLFDKSNQPQRLHQEDFCQALGISFDKKYEQYGGPNFQDCFNLIQQITLNPMQDTDNLLRWQIFNVLAGNSDGHAKNLAVLYNENHQPILAPFYDLVCTRAVERIDINLALSVGGEYNPNNLKLHHWEQLARDCHIRPQYLKKTLKDTAGRLLDNFQKTQQSFSAMYGEHPALQRVNKVVKKMCGNTLKMLRNGYEIT